MRTSFQKKREERGFILLLAVLIASILLAMSMGVFAISLKEVALATFARDSSRAFAAASRGLECAMFLDRITVDGGTELGNSPTYYTDGSTFPSRAPILGFTPFSRGPNPTFSSVGNGSQGEQWPMNDTIAGSNFTAGFQCNGVTPIPYTATAVNPSTGNPFIDGHSGDSTFSLNFTDSCVDVVVAKRGITTTFTSNGFSDCNPSNPRRTQRTIEVSVNI